MIPTSASSTTDCPVQTRLRAFVLAQLSTDEMNEVEQHLAHCEHCLTTVEVCEEESDLLIQALATLPPGPDDEPEFQRLQATLLSTTMPLRIEDLPTTEFSFDTTTCDDPIPGAIGSYEIEELLGRGATGAVYRARHAKLDRTVAIKVLNTQYLTRDLGAMERFQNEMRAVGQLEHPHIVRATDAGEFDGHHFLVMEYIEGLDLSRLLRLVGPLRVPDACEIVRQAALGLDFAHEHQWVHRDIKLSNLLLTTSETVKVLDLGLVSASSDTPAYDSKDDLPRGTADYMPPEQWTSFASVDRRADIYSLGCTLYRLLTGRAVYATAAHDYAAKRAAHERQPIPHLRSHRPDAPLGLQRIIQRMLAKKPGDRYRTAAEVAEHLQPFADGARLDQLARRIKTIDSNEWTSIHEPSDVAAAGASHPTRRRWLIALAASAPLAAAGVWGIRRSRPAKLVTNTWRTLQAAEPFRDYVLTTPPFATETPPNVSSEEDDESQASFMDDHWQVNARGLGLLSMGKPVNGKFSLRCRIEITRSAQHVGLYFRQRPKRVDDALALPFQVIELSSLDSDDFRVSWSHYCIYDFDNRQVTVEQTPWADVQPSRAPGRSVQLQVTLGRIGFPEVEIDGIALAPTTWTQAFEATLMGKLSRDELARAYLGNLGLFVQNGQAQFSNVALAYLD